MCLGRSAAKATALGRDAGRADARDARRDRTRGGRSDVGRRPDGHVYREYGTLGEVLVLIHPDWHVGLVAAATDGDAVSAYLAQAVAGPARAARGGT
jgi:hypothetical protein